MLIWNILELRFSRDERTKVHNITLLNDLKLHSIEAISLSLSYLKIQSQQSHKCITKCVSSKRVVPLCYILSLFYSTKRKVITFVSGVVWFYSVFFLVIVQLKFQNTFELFDLIMSFTAFCKVLMRKSVMFFLVICILYFCLGS